MQRILWRLAAATSGILVAFAGPAQAGRAGGSCGCHRDTGGSKELAGQVAHTSQNADSSAKSVQFLPVNANVPVQVLSFGRNGGPTRQSNDSTAISSARNRSNTDQSLRQSGSKAGRDHGGKDGERPDRGEKDHRGNDHGGKGHDGKDGDVGDHGHKRRGGDDGPRPDRGAKDHRGGNGEGRDRGDKRHGDGDVRAAGQQARTDQDASSHAKSVQFVPINANVPVQVLSFGHNGGPTRQSNDSTAISSASNRANTDQDATPDQGRGPGSGYRDRGAPAAGQQARTDQDASSHAKSVQVVPVNANVPVQVLSFGSNGGPTSQSNDSTAISSASNRANTDQDATPDQGRGPGSGDGVQAAGQQATTDQDAKSSADSTQIAPINANVPVQVLSFGSNGGPTSQSNDSTAISSATNHAGTSQGLGQVEGLPAG